MNLFSEVPYEKALDAASLRMKVTSNNLAHMGDPNFCVQSVAFERQMDEALQKSDSDDEQDREEGKAEMCALEPTVTSDAGTRVDMQQEMANMAKTQILYTALTRKVSGDLSSLKYVTDNGR